MSVTVFSTVWILILLVLLGILYFVNVKAKDKFKFSTRLIISTLIGLVAGIIFQATVGMVGANSIEAATNNVTNAASLVGKGFTSLLRMIVIPLIGISIYNAIINTKSDKNLKTLSIKTVLYYTGTVLISAIIGIVIAMAFNVGKGMTLPAGIEGWTGKGEYKGIVDVILNFIPSNVVKAMAETSVVGVVIFAAFMGFGTNRVGQKHPEKVKLIKEFTEGLFAVLTSVTITIIKIIPYGVAALMFNLAASNGLDVFKDLLVYFTVMVIGLVTVFLMQTMNLVIHGVNPFKFYKKALAPLVLAFTSTTSMGTLPVTIETLESEVGVSTTTANFVAPLGTSIGMNGCAGVFPAVIAIMVANMTGVPITPVFIISLLIIIALGSFGMAGVPGTAYIAATIVLGGLGLPFEPVAIVFPVDTLVDMGRTMINVNGAMTIATVVDKEMGTLDNEKMSK